MSTCCTRLWKKVVISQPSSGIQSLGSYVEVLEGENARVEEVSSTFKKFLREKVMSPIFGAEDIEELNDLLASFSGMLALIIYFILFILFSCCCDELHA
jgi:hypothetical protein